MTVKVDIFARNLEVNDRLKEYITKKASKLDRYLSEIEQVKVDLDYIQISPQRYRSLCSPDHCKRAPSIAAYRRTFR